MSDYQPPDPYALTRREQAQVLPRRFYKLVSTAAQADGHVVLLDGKPARRSDGAALVLPDAGLAGLLAAEWAAQATHIDLASMPLTSLAMRALAASPEQCQQWHDDILAYAGSDLLCYRAAHPAALQALQARHWDGPLAWARAAFHAPFAVTTGISAIEQPAAALQGVREHLAPARDAPLRLAGLHAMTALLGSALLALMCGAGALSLDAAWSAAHVDEDFQIAQWGQDEEARQRRDARARDFAAAARLARGHEA
ncbi:MAG: ATPase [Hyphomicrobiales bacterium]|nr:ATPase [Hyphomicrobiales bacterium]